MGARTLVVGIVTLVLGAASALKADLQLAPTVGEYELEGIKLKHLVFSDGSGTQITYQPPRDWDYSGSATKLTVRPRDNAQAEGTITTVRLPEPAKFDEETVGKLTEQALASVPESSTDVKMESQELNPLLINGKETLLVTLSYTVHGEKYARSMLFLNRDAEQVRFQFVSRQADFAPLQRAFQGSQFSWQGL